MKKSILLIFILFFSFQTFSAVTPSAIDNFPVAAKTRLTELPPPVLSYVATMKIKEVEKLLGRKMKLKEKLAFKLYQIKLKKDARRAEQKANNGKTSMILGIVGLASIFIPYLFYAAIPCLILALIFGYTTKKNYPTDSHAKVGIILGWVGIGGIIVLIAVIAAILAGGFWG